MPNKNKRKSKSMVNKRFRRKKKKTIKLKRKFPIRRSRKRKRKQKGGAWYSAITDIFGKKKTPEFTNIQQYPNNPPGKATNTFLGQFGQKINGAKETVLNAATDAQKVFVDLKNTGVKDINKSAMNDFQKLENDFKKLQEQFRVIGDWITKRTKDPTKCPCCKQVIQKAPDGRGVPVQIPPTTTPATPATQQALSMGEMQEMQKMQMQIK